MGYLVHNYNMLMKNCIQLELYFQTIFMSQYDCGNIQHSVHSYANILTQLLCINSTWITLKYVLEYSVSAWTIVMWFAP